MRPYDPVADFASLSSVARAPLVLAVHPSVPARSVAEFIDLARSAHGDIGYATSAIGGAPHLAGELFQAMANVTLRFRRYDRTRQLYEDLLAGRVESSFNNMMSMARYVDEKKLRGLAVTSAARCPLLPALPTISESGLPGYEISNWLGLVAPAGTPGGIVSAHNDAIGAALRHPDLIELHRHHAELIWKYVIIAFDCIGSSD